MTEYQWNLITPDEKLIKRLEQTRSEFGTSNHGLVEILLDLHQREKIKAGELKDVQQSTLKVISGDFLALDDFTRGMQRVFLAMVEKLGVRESEAIKEANILKKQVNSLLEKHAAELNKMKEEKEAVEQLMEVLHLEHERLQKETELFSEIENSLKEKIWEQEEELKQGNDRISELEAKLSVLEPIAIENEQLQKDLELKKQELLKEQSNHTHAISDLKLKHEKDLDDNVKMAKETVQMEYEKKIETIQNEYETKMETTKQEYEAKIEAILQEYVPKIEKIQNEYETKLEKHKKVFDLRIDSLRETWITISKKKDWEAREDERKAKKQIEELRNESNKEQERLKEEIEKLQIKLNEALEFGKELQVELEEKRVGKED